MGPDSYKATLGTVAEDSSDLQGETGRVPRNENMGTSHSQQEINTINHSTNDILI